MDLLKLSDPVLYKDLSLLMRSAAALCLLQLAQLFMTCSRSMQTLSTSQLSSCLHSSYACLLGIREYADIRTMNFDLQLTHARKGFQNSNAAN